MIQTDKELFEKYSTVKEIEGNCEECKSFVVLKTAMKHLSINQFIELIAERDGETKIVVSSFGIKGRIIESHKNDKGELVIDKFEVDSVAKINNLKIENKNGK